MSRPVRTIVAAILLAALIVTGVAIVVPLIARPMIVAAVESEAPFGGDHLQVDVDCNVFGLLQGSIDRIHVHGTDLARSDASGGNVVIGAVDVTLTDVATSGHAFRGISGTLASIDVPTDDGATFTIDQVKLDGSSSNLSAVAALGRRAAVRLIEAAFADGGVDVSGVELGNGTVGFEVFGAKAQAPVGAENGALVLVDPFGQGSFEILAPSDKDGWRFTGAGITPDGMSIQATLDLEKLLAGR